MQSKQTIAIAGSAVLAGGLLYALMALRSPSEEPAQWSEPQAQTDLDHPPMAPLDFETDDPEALEAALEKNPEHTPILMQMAEVARTQGDLEKAAVRYREIITADPSNLDAPRAGGSAIRLGRHGGRNSRE